VLDPIDGDSISGHTESISDDIGSVSLEMAAAAIVKPAMH
jgi:hypothetical protein